MNYGILDRVKPLSDFSIMTSNAKKQGQFRDWLHECPIVPDAGDAREVLAYPEAVAMYKSKQAGPMTIVEDTALYAFAAPHLNPSCIRWNEHALLHSPKLSGTPVRVESWLAVNDGEHITTYRGATTGTWITPETMPDDCNDLDAAVVPEDCTKCIHDLLKGRRFRRDRFTFGSPSHYRLASIINLLNDISESQIKIDDLPVWHGEWQK